MVGITAQMARELFRYDPETGALTWAVRRKGTNGIGKPAGCVSNGYITVRVDGKYYRAHRLAWLITHGEHAKAEIDHINGVRSDNRLANLRAATSLQQAQNMAKRTDNKSGIVGVCWLRDPGAWLAQIQVAGKKFRLGYFDCKEDAAAAYQKAKAELHTFNPIQRAT